MTSTTPREVLIETEYLSDFPPLACWQATGPNHDLGSLVGFGPTREAAIESLIEQAWEDFSIEGFCAMMGEEEQ